MYLRDRTLDGLTESEARAAWLVRAFESPFTPPWTAEDGQWATREALRAEGEGAPPARFIARRAMLACSRLAQRGVPVPSAGPAGALAWALAGAAFVLGLASESVASASRINILAPPLLALLAWNLGVYLALLTRWLLRRVRGSAPAAPSQGNAGPPQVFLSPAGGGLGAARPWGRSQGNAGPPQVSLSPAGGGLGAARPWGHSEGPLRHVWRALMARRARWQAAHDGRGAAAFARFIEHWTQAAAPLHAARVAAALHAAAAMLAVGALLSLYARGLAFEYRAGWDSTFLSATSVHALLTAVLGPASQLSGIALPDAAALEHLRLSQGPGENAAPWIHLHALTLMLAVIVPRVLLAAAAVWRLRHLRRAIVLPLDDAYFGPLWRSHAGHATSVQVQPYSYRLDPSLRAGLEAALTRHLGSRVQMQLAEPVPQGAEDAPTVTSPAGDVTVALLTLTATPEPETHGAFLRALVRAHGRDGVRVLIDESGFRRRFTGVEGEARRAQRRAAWERLLRDEGVEPWFADLAGTPHEAEPGEDAAWAGRGGLAPR